MLGESWLAGLGWLVLLQPLGITSPSRTTDNLEIGARLQLAQTDAIKGQDPETADRGQGNSGWVQAPVTRGHNAPEQAAQGAGAAAVGTSGHTITPSAAQPSADQNPGTPVTTPLPGHSGVAPASAAK